MTTLSIRAYFTRKTDNKGYFVPADAESCDKLRRFGLNCRELKMSIPPHADSYTGEIVVVRVKPVRYIHAGREGNRPIFAGIDIKND